ncbi:MAG: hypothetical protein IIW76_00045 [Bacteroidales bacterium]|nr:hypothetical protein [Bacteroidales bacterium]
MSIIVLVISFILNLASKIVTPIGLIAFFFMIAEGDFEILITMGILGVVGIVYGIIAFRYDIPPRMFWTDSANEIFSYSVGTVIGYGLMFALWVPFIMVFEMI